MEVNDVVYRMVFTNLDQIYTIYSLGVSEETLVGFIEVDAILSIASEMQIAEEDTKAQYFLQQMQGIKRTYIPMHSVIRIDEMTKKHYDFSIVGGHEKLSNIKPIHGGQFSMQDANT